MVTSSSNKDNLIAKLIEWSINNKFMIIILTVALIFGGVWAMINTPVDAIPDIGENQQIVFTPDKDPELWKTR